MGVTLKGMILLSLRDGKQINSGQNDSPWRCSIHFNPIAPRKAKIVCNFGLSECNRVNLNPLQNVQILMRTTRARGYKTFFVVNSVEHEISNAHKYRNIKKFSCCQAQISGECYFSCS